MPEKSCYSIDLPVQGPPRDSRRHFLCKLGGLLGSAAAMHALPACEVSDVYLKPTGGTLDFDVTKAAFHDLAQVGGTVSLDTHGQKILMIRSSDIDVTVLSRICPHELCDMSPDDRGTWDQATKRLTCNCHTSIFDVTGRVLSGPAQTNLRHYTVLFDGAKGTVAL